MNECAGSCQLCCAYAPSSPGPPLPLPLPLPTRVAGTDRRRISSALPPPPCCRASWTPRPYSGRRLHQGVGHSNVARYLLSPIAEDTIFCCQRGGGCFLISVASVLKVNFHETQQVLADINSILYSLSSSAISGPKGDKSCLPPPAQLVNVVAWPVHSRVFHPRANWAAILSGWS